MFWIGIFIGLSLPYIYNAATLIFKADTALKDLSNTSTISNLKFMCKCAALFAEQHLTQSFKYDSARKRYIITFYVKGQLHQLLVRPVMGPGLKKYLDPVARGYACLDTSPLVK